MSFLLVTNQNLTRLSLSKGKLEPRQREEKLEAKLMFLLHTYLCIYANMGHPTGYSLSFFLKLEQKFRELSRIQLMYVRK
jgi:hypothetical protein